MTDTSNNRNNDYKMLVGVAVLVLIGAFILLATGKDKDKAIESSNTGVSSGVNRGEEAVPPKEAKNY